MLARVCGVIRRGPGAAGAVRPAEAAAAAGAMARRHFNVQADMPPDISRVALPPRTVPEHLITFKTRTYLSSDTRAPYPNVHGVHQAEFKVVLSARVGDLALTRAQERRLAAMAGPRFDARARTLRLASDIFPSRVENKKYLVYQLEMLLAEARREPTGAQAAAEAHARAPPPRYSHRKRFINTKFAGGVQ